MFQVLDVKNECVGFYKNGKIIKELTVDMDHTWNYTSILHGKDIQYAHIYCGGKTIDECCPEHLKDEWERVNKKIKAFLNSFVESKVSLDENCVFDLIPERFLKEFYDAKCKITEHVFKNYPQPPEYTFTREFGQFISDISTR